jgi:hypothetical protein
MNNSVAGAAMMEAVTGSVSWPSIEIGISCQGSGVCYGDRDPRSVRREVITQVSSMLTRTRSG